MTHLGSEHPYGDTIQLFMSALFFIMWSADCFIFNYSTALVEVLPLVLRLTLGFLSLSVGTYLAVKSIKVVFVEMHEQPTLIDSGVFSRVRHPMYLGTLLFLLGFFFFIPSLLSLAIWILFFALYDRIATYEEKDLVRILGDAYLAYQKRVPKWLPLIRKQK